MGEFFIMKNFKEFVEKNKNLAYTLTRENATYDKDGHVILTKKDPEYYDTEWDDYKLEVNNTEKT